jgi:hypothetical protein
MWMQLYSILCCNSEYSNQSPSFSPAKAIPPQATHKFWCCLNPCLVLGLALISFNSNPQQEATTSSSKLRLKMKIRYGHQIFYSSLSRSSRLPRCLNLLILVFSSCFDFLLVRGLVFLSPLFGSILVLVDRHGIRGC